MTVKEAINGLRVMLGQDIPTQEVALEQAEDQKDEQKAFASAELVDDTVVYAEGEIAVGATLFVETENDEDPFAPQGIHSTKDGLVITVGEAGEITSIEEEAPEAEAVEEEVVEEAMEEATEEEVKAEEEEEKEEAFDAEVLLAAIADMIKDYSEEINKVKEDMSSLTERFNSIADAPAAEAIKKQSFMEEAKAARDAAEARLSRLARMRNEISKK